MRGLTLVFYGRYAEAAVPLSESVPLREIVHAFRATELRFACPACVGMRRALGGDNCLEIPGLPFAQTGLQAFRRRARPRQQGSDGCCVGACSGAREGERLPAGSPGHSTCVLPRLRSPRPLAPAMAPPRWLRGFARSLCGPSRSLVRLPCPPAPGAGPRAPWTGGRQALANCRRGAVRMGLWRRFPRWGRPLTALTSPV